MALGSRKRPFESRNDRPWRARGPARRGLRIVGSADWNFTDVVPPPIRGQVGGIPVSLHVWPPDCIPMHPEARRLRSGVLSDYWVLVRFP